MITKKNSIFGLLFLAFLTNSSFLAADPFSSSMEQLDELIKADLDESLDQRASSILEQLLANKDVRNKLTLVKKTGGHQIATLGSFKKVDFKFDCDPHYGRRSDFDTFIICSANVRKYKKESEYDPQDKWDSSAEHRVNENLILATINAKLAPKGLRFVVIVDSWKRGWEGQDDFKLVIRNI